MRWLLGLILSVSLIGCGGEDKPSNATAIKIAKELQLQEPFIHASEWKVVNGYSKQPGKYTSMITYKAEFKKSLKEIARARIDDLTARGVPWVKIPWGDAIIEHLRVKYGRYVARGTIAEAQIELTLTKTEQGWILVDEADAPKIL